MKAGLKAVYHCQTLYKFVISRVFSFLDVLYGTSFGLRMNILTTVVSFEQCETSL
jgi:hypothetical protein